MGDNSSCGCSQGSLVRQHHSHRYRSRAVASQEGLSEGNRREIRKPVCSVLCPAHMEVCSSEVLLFRAMQNMLRGSMSHSAWQHLEDPEVGLKDSSMAG